MDARHAIIQSAEHEYANLMAAVHGLDEARMTEKWLGTWGVRQIVAHIAGWHREMTPALDRVARGEPPYADGAYDDFDRWNARFVDERRDVATGDLLRELDASHRAFVHAIGRLSDSQLAEGGAARSLVDGVGPGHYREHAGQIAEWRSSHSTR
jgi:Protein of unknown function (DUF1706)